MKLNSKTRYAVMAMAELCMRSNDDNVSCVTLSLISQNQNLPLPYLEQLFLKLKRAKLVSSHRGAAGGYTLTMDPSDISIQDIIVAVDKELKATRCENTDGHGCQPGGAQCVTHDLWDELTILMETFLSKVTLKDVCAGRVKGLGRFGFMDASAHHSAQNTHPSHMNAAPNNGQSMARMVAQ